MQKSIKQNQMKTNSNKRAIRQLQNNSILVLQKHFYKIGHTTPTINSEKVVRQFFLQLLLKSEAINNKQRYPVIKSIHVTIK